MPSTLKLILSAALVLLAAPNAFAAPSGEQLFTRKGCIGCHTLRGHEGAVGKMGPDLSRLGRERDRDFLIPWIQDPRAHSPGTRMPTLGLTRQEAQSLADYLLAERPRKPRRR